MKGWDRRIEENSKRSLRTSGKEFVLYKPLFFNFASLLFKKLQKLSSLRASLNFFFIVSLKAPGRS